MKLYTTPLSHFARKARLLLDLYGVPYEPVEIDGVVKTEAAHYANNPLMKVPTLVDGDTWLIESDHIAGYVVQKVDPSDRYRVFTRDVFDLNVRAVLNGAMTEEVKVIMAGRMGVKTGKYPFFSKALMAVSNALAWLETNHARFTADKPTYRELHLVCFWEHLAYYELVPLEYPGLRKVVEQVGRNPLVHKTSPHVVKPK